MRSYYELLSLPSDADANSIKTAFRREIARYHPDKVIHLGAEFQEMAATRAAELTVAYKTLTDQALRAEYDLSLEGDESATTILQTPAPARPTPPPAPPADDAPAFTAPSPSPGHARFETERAGRDVILRRALTIRVQGIVESLYGPVQTPTVRGFDIAFVPKARARLLAAPLPRVLLKVFDTVDASSVNEGWTNASRARLHTGNSPIIVLLCGRKVAQQHELSKAIQALTRRPRGPDSPTEIAVVAVDTSDWSCRLPPDASPAVRKLIDQIRK